MQIFQVDAFTRHRFTGNPATVILDADGESDATLAAIAREFPHAETVFALPPSATDHDIHLRFFNARKEAPFVGHASIAAHAVLLAAGRRPPGTIRQRSGTGILEVCASPDDGDAGSGAFVEFRQAAPSFDAPLGINEVEAVARQLGLPTDTLNTDLPARISRRGSSRMLLAVRDSATLNRIEPRFEALAALGAEIMSEGFFVFCQRREAAGVSTRSRMFCPALGIPEDPVSGNAHAMLAGHLWDLGQFEPNERHFTGYQGEQMRRPGTVQVTMEIAAGEMTAARIGGHAVIVSRGTLD
jgi:PhzF family phenazine biosynthesis protein